MGDLSKTSFTGRPSLRIQIWPRTPAERKWRDAWATQESEQLKLEMDRLEKQTISSRAAMKELLDKMEKDAEAQAQRKAASRLERRASTKPPVFAELIGYALTKPKYRQGIVGDRAEVFSNDVRVRGRSAAVRFYWIDTIRLLYPAMKRLLPWAVVGETLRRWLNS